MAGNDRKRDHRQQDTGPARRAPQRNTPERPPSWIAGDLPSMSMNNSVSEGRDEVRGKLIVVAILVIVSLPVWLAIIFS